MTSHGNQGSDVDAQATEAVQAWLDGIISALNEPEGTATAWEDLATLDERLGITGLDAARVRLLRERVRGIKYAAELREKQLSEIVQSRSWRFTAPLRALRRADDNGAAGPVPGAGGPPPTHVDPTVVSPRESRPHEGETGLAVPANPFAAFDEAFYLESHPDVAEHVLTGALPSGLHHFIHHGAAEGRISSGWAPYAARTGSVAALSQKPEGLDLVGPLSASSGLGVSSRGYEQAARAVGLLGRSYDVNAYVDMENPEAWAPHMPSRGVILVKNADILPRFFSQFDLANLNDTYVFAVWVWELMAFRPEWFCSFGAVDEVWAPSTFVQEAVSTVSPVPVSLVPHVVGAGLPPQATVTRRDLGLPDGAFTFLYAFDAASYVERKNPVAAVQAFRSAFGTRTDVHLVLKYHSARGAGEDFPSLRKAVAGAANITLLNRRLTESESWSLKMMCDAFVSPHRAEGFGLNVAEAMLVGKPVLSTDYSGTTDFVTEHTGYPISYTLRPVGREIGPYSRHAVWADVHTDHLADVMRHVLANPDEAAARGARAALEIQQRFSPEAIGSIVRERYTAAGLAGSSTSARPARTRSLAQRHPLATSPGPDRAVLNSLRERPLISVVVPVYNVEAELLWRCIRSVQRQRYPFWDLCFCNDASTDPETLAVLAEVQGTDARIKVVHLERNSHIAAATNKAVEVAAGEFVAFLDNDDELHPDALWEVARVIAEQPFVDVLYTDEDKLDEQGRHVDDYHKPDWSPELLETNMYLLHLLVVRKALLLEVGGLRDEYAGAQDYDLALRLSRATREIHHIPQVLYHWRKIAGSAAAEVDAKPYGLERAKAALAEHVETKYQGAARVIDGSLPGFFRVTRDHRPRPPVTLVIPTNNATVNIPGRGRINLLDNLVSSIQENTKYDDYRLLIVDNDNLRPAQGAALRRSGHETATYSGPTSPFNFADKANFAFNRVETEHFVFMNDDMEVLTEDWLSALMDHAQNEEVGVVGAKLLSTEGLIQHAGVVGGVLGGPAHVFYGAPADAVGYSGYTHAVRNYSMVTGACMATRREVISEVGGFDRRLAISYNDVDFCLSAVAKGWRVVYTPYAVLRHFESVSLPREAPDAEEGRIFRAKWRHSRMLADDPWYNPNLSRHHTDFRRAVPLS